MINACCNLYFCFIITVHGDIRHLEKSDSLGRPLSLVHGDIRHLENSPVGQYMVLEVHGGIRHLEIDETTDLV